MGRKRRKRQPDTPGVIYCRHGEATTEPPKNASAWHFHDDMPSNPFAPFLVYELPDAEGRLWRGVPTPNGIVWTEVRPDPTH